MAYPIRRVKLLKTRVFTEIYVEPVKYINRDDPNLSQT